jgi:hypothetical protein
MKNTPGAAVKPSIADTQSVHALCHILHDNYKAHAQIVSHNPVQKNL